MKVVIAGASGFLGKLTSKHFTSKGVEVVRLVRTSPVNRLEYFWNPYKGEIPLEAIEHADLLINFCGASLTTPFWTKNNRANFFSSRLIPATTLVNALLRAKNPPKVFISMSGAGYYNSLKEVDEASPKGSGFLSDLSARWEEEAYKASPITRVALLRSGAILDHEVGFYPNLVRLAKWLHIVPQDLSLDGEPIFLPWIAGHDFLGVLEHTMANKEVEGPINVVAPTDTTLHDFYTQLQHRYNISLLFRLPHFLETQQLRELLTHSASLHPQKLLRTNFNFRFKKIHDFIFFK